MATLEIHDGRGQVFQVEVEPSADTVFGSDPSCDIVVNDPRAQAFVPVVSATRIAPSAPAAS